MNKNLENRSWLGCHDSLANKTAFVTGGMGGIGKAIVEALLTNGANVAFSYAANSGQQTETEAWVNQNPKQLSAHALELRSLKSIQECFHAARQRWRQLDILVNNAAVGTATVSQYATEISEQDSIMFLINSDGALKVCQEFLKTIPQKVQTDEHRKIINISSVGGGLQAFPGFRLSDGMSKAAVAFLTKQLAAEHVHTHTDVFAICPGATNTSMFQQSTLVQMTETERIQFIASLPKQRLIEPHEIANVVLFLASSYSTPLHGAVLDASMGLGVRPGLITEHH